MTAGRLSGLARLLGRVLAFLVAAGLGIGPIVVGLVLCVFGHPLWAAWPAVVPLFVTAIVLRHETRAQFSGLPVTAVGLLICYLVSGLTVAAGIGVGALILHATTSAGHTPRVATVIAWMAILGGGLFGGGMAGLTTALWLPTDRPSPAPAEPEE